MKSAFGTLIILIAIFAILKCGALDVISSPIFHYFSFGLLIAVFAAAYFLIGFQDKNVDQNIPTLPQNPEKEADDDQ